jgi:protein phosphatase
MSVADFHDTTISRPPRRTPEGKLFVPDSSRVAVELAGLTHPGKSRSNNEDNYAVIRRSRSQDVLLTSHSPASFPPHSDVSHLFLMADGMGGAAFGELASSLAIRSVWSLSEQATNWVMKIAEFDAEAFKNRVDAYVERVQQSFRESVHAKPHAAGMGTTMTAVYVMGWDAVLVQIGDSRAYLYRQGRLRRMTQDHTVGEQLVHLGMSPELAKSFRHMLTTCLGCDSKSAYPDLDYERLQPGDILLLATDGLTDVVPDDVMMRRLGESANLRAVCQALVNDALDAGGPDNVTVVAARFTEAGDD